MATLPDREKAALQGLRQLETHLDSNLQTLDSLVHEDVRKLQAQRIKALKAEAAQLQQWRCQNHGAMNEVASQKDWFSEVKDNERTITHFYHPTSQTCQIMDGHLQKIVGTHMETKFLRMNVEKSPYLCERLDISVMPTLILTKDCFTSGTIEGFDELGGTDTFSTATLESLLVAKGALDMVAPPEPTTRPTNQAVKSGVVVYDSDDSEDW